MVAKKTASRNKTASRKKSAGGKRTVARKAATRKATAKKKAAVKRSSPAKKRTAPKKKPATAKKTPAKKRTAAKKSVTRKSAAKKKTPVRKAATAAKRRPVAKKKAAPKRKTAVKKKTPASRKAVAKKQASAKSGPEKTQLVKEAKKKKRIELLKKKRAAVDLPVEGVPVYTMHRGESYMSPNQLEHFRSKLLQWKQDLLDEVSRTVDHMKKDASQFADPADRATQEEEFSLELRTRDREGKLVRKINQTLASIDADEYGYCESCGVEIGIERLEARPTATLCIDCKTLQEIKEKQSFT